MVTIGNSVGFIYFPCIFLTFGVLICQEVFLIMQSLFSLIDSTSFYLIEFKKIDVYKQNSTVLIGNVYSNYFDN